MGRADTSMCATFPKGRERLIDQPQQVAFGDLLFQLAVVEQRFGWSDARHDQQASKNEDQGSTSKDCSLIPRLTC
jgi:hypothetical protein